MDMIKAFTKGVKACCGQIKTVKKFKKTIAISKNYVIMKKVRYEIRPYQPGS